MRAQPEAASRNRWTWFLLGILCIAVPVLGIAWWIFVAQTTSGDQADLVRRYLSSYPRFLQNARLLTVIELAFCAGAMGFAYRGLSERGAPRTFSLLLLGFSGLIGFWLLFSLM